MTKKLENKQLNQETTVSLNIYQKLQQVQHKVGQLKKDQLNKFQNYKYVGEYDIFRALRPLLNQQNLVLTFSDEINFASENTLPIFQSEKIEKEWVVKYLKKMILTNADNPSEQLTYHCWAPGQNTDIAKAKGSAETYAIKYFLLKFFLIPTSDNLDPDDQDSETAEKFDGITVKPTPKATITLQQVQELSELLKAKGGKDKQVQVNFLTKFDEVMTSYGIVGPTNNSNFKGRLTILTATDYQALMNYLNNLPK